MLAVGTTGRAACRVESANTAPNMGSGDLAVVATPSMIALMESAASKSVLPLLNPGETTVGTHMDVTHTSATPVGMEIRAESRLEEIDGRRLVFSVKAYDETGTIGEGIHERFIVQKEKFMLKAEAKKGHAHD